MHGLMGGGREPGQSARPAHPGASGLPDHSLWLRAVASCRFLCVCVTVGGRSLLQVSVCLCNCGYRARRMFDVSGVWWRVGEGIDGSL